MTAAAVPDPWVEAMRYSARVTAQARHFVATHKGRKLEASDLYQEGMIVAHDVLAGTAYDPRRETCPGAYVATAVRNHFIDLDRRQAHACRTVSLDPDRVYARPDRVDEAMLGEVETAIDGIEPRARYVLHGYYVPDGRQAATVESIAGVIGTCRREVWRIKRQAIEAVRRMLGAA